MAKTRSETAAKSAGKPAGGTTMPSFDMTPLINANQSGMRAVVEAQEHMLKRMTKLNGEMLDFVNRRLETDRETAQEMASCKTLSEAASVYSRFLQDMMKDYTEEMGTIAGLCAEQARETMDEMQEQMSKTVGKSVTEGKTD